MGERRVSSQNNGIKLAGAAGFEPANAGTKNRCLNHLATPQQIGAAK